jgi:hypothetical protein
MKYYVLSALQQYSSGFLDNLESTFPATDGTAVPGDQDQQRG